MTSRLQTLLWAFFAILNLLSCENAKTYNDVWMNNDADAADGWDGDIQSDAETMTEKKFSFCEVDDEKIKEIMSGMTLRDMIGQKYIIGVSRTNWDLSAETKEKIEKLKIGGVFLAAPETIDLDPENTFEFIRILQEFSVEKNGVPLFISVDQEGGHAANINSMTGGTDTPGNMSLGAAQDAGDVERIYAIMGEELFSLGFNMDFAPVVDLMKNHMNGAINIRSFGGDAGWVRKAGAGSVRGLQSEGVIATVKHFPSDSTTALDSHIARPVYQKDENYWRSNDMLPYIDAFGAGADAVMMGHFILPFFDEKKPASLSAYIQNKILREEMGFDGLIITDSLGMKGANPEGKEESPELMAFKAGADIALRVSYSAESAGKVIDEVAGAVNSGDLDESRIEESVYRILKAKMKYCLFDEKRMGVAWDEAKNGLMKDESLAASQNAADKSVVLMEDDGLLLPLDPSAKVLVVSPGKLYHDPASGWMNAVGMTMGEALEKHHGNVTKIELFYPPDVFYFDQVQSEAGAHDIILFATLNAHYSEMHVEFAQAVADIGKPVIAVALGVPYDAADFTGYEAFVAVMGQRSVSLEAAAKFLTGKIGANGTLPVEMP